MGLENNILNNASTDKKKSKIQQTIDNKKKINSDIKLKDSLKQEKEALIKQFEEKLKKVKDSWSSQGEKGQEYITYAEGELSAIKKGGIEEWKKYIKEFDDHKKIETFTTKDGFNWEIKTKEEALELFNNDLELYIVTRSDETERLVESEEDFNNIGFDEFYAEEGDNKNLRANEVNFGR